MLFCHLKWGVRKFLLIWLRGTMLSNSYQDTKMLVNPIAEITWLECLFREWQAAKTLKG